MTTIDTVTREQVERLMAEAGEAGDMEQVRLCGLALKYLRAEGDAPRSNQALAKCVRAIRAAEAMECEGHPAGPYDPMGETVYCDGSCAAVRVRR